MYKLIIEDDEGKTTVVPLIRDEITIGRKEGNTIRLTERNVSRRHAKLVRSGGSILIEDLGSHNGIRINGERVSARAPLAEGDRIQIGDYQLALKLDQKADRKVDAKSDDTASAPDEVRTEERTAPYPREGEATESRPTVPGIPTVAQTILAEPEPPVARLVAVSSNFARREFPLDKPTVVIGRTAENDIALDHRSISRHHAKIVREGDRFHVVDLQSANGVRVNGESYARAELRKGDHIDFGHVRLRFVAPGEPFQFDRDAHVVDVPEERGRSGLVLAGAAALIIGLGAYTAMKFMGGSGPSPGEVDSVEIQVNRLNVEVDRSLRAMDWDDAIAKSERGLQLDPTQETLRDKRTRAEREKSSRSMYDSFTASVSAGDFDGAVARFQALARDSVYREKAHQSYEAVRRGYVKSHLAQALAAQSAARCDEARREAALVLVVDEGNADAQEIERRCGEPTSPRKIANATAKLDRAQADRAPLERTGTTAPTTVAAAPRAPEPASSSERSVATSAAPSKMDQREPSDETERLISDAMEEYAHGNYASASEMAQRANRSGSNPKAWRVIGASACFQKNRDEAVRAWNKLGSYDRQFLKYVCDRNQIKIP